MKVKSKSDLKDRNARQKRLEKAVYAIRQGDDFEREKAIEYLVSHPTKKTVERLIPLLQEKDTPTRMAVVEVLKEIGHANIEAIAGLLNDENEDIRVFSCEIMTAMRNPETIPYLIKVLGNGSESVKNAAVIALGEFNDERAVNALLGMLQDDQWIVFSAICSLGKSKHRAAIEPLLRVLRHSDEEVSLAACEALMGFEDNDILDKMFTILKGWSKKKRERYIEIIIQQGNENLFLRLKQNIGQELFEHLLSYVTFKKTDLIPILKLMVHFKSMQTCEILLENLIKMDPEEPEYTQVLQFFSSLSQIWMNNIHEFLNKGDEYALAIVQACSLAKVKISEDTLLASFLTATTPVRREIAKNAHTILAGNGYSLLKEAVNDQDGHVQSFAVTAIGSLRLKNLESEIIALSKKGFMDVRINALKALLVIDNDEAMRLLMDFVNSDSTEDKKIYLAVAKNITGDLNFPLIKTLIARNDEDIKRSAVNVIGNFIEDERYGKIFQKLLQIDNIPHEVLKIIKEKRLAQFKPFLNKIFSDSTKSLWTRYYALLALGALGDPTLFELFVQGLNDENSLIKIGSLKALSDLRDKKAIVYVEPLVNDTDDDVRSTAEFVIGSLGNSY
jgi:HEAT repeat protein